MFTAFPNGFHKFGSGEIPIRTAFLQHGTQVLPKFFDGRSAKKPVAVVDLEYKEVRFEDDEMRDRRIVPPPALFTAKSRRPNLATVLSTRVRTLSSF
jgi:hypothetical protein